MNPNFMKKILRQEVDVALKNMALLKAPGPNGMPPIFFSNTIRAPLVMMFLV